jgi:dTDP-4-dehydrorhamnose 3,5-epimerase
MSFEFQQLAIPDLLLVRPKVFTDERGFFKEIYQFSEFFAAGMRRPFLQANHSLSKKNILRGLHYQKRPFAQAKLVRVLRGEIFDVAVDLRKNSPWYAQHVTLTLKADDHQMFFIPEGFAHGFLTMSEEAEVEYFCSDIYSPENERGIVFNDPSLGIAWPLKNPIVSKKDSLYPHLASADHHFIYEK